MNKIDIFPVVLGAAGANIFRSEALIDIQKYAGPIIIHQDDCEFEN